MTYVPEPPRWNSEVRIKSMDLELAYTPLHQMLPVLVPPSSQTRAAQRVEQYVNMLSQPLVPIVSLLQIRNHEAQI